MSKTAYTATGLATESGDGMPSSQLVKEPRKPPLLGAFFNQDGRCFAVGSPAGFTVYNSDPLEAWVTREFDDGGIAIVAMLYRTNFLALVGGGPRPKYPQNKVVLWDDRAQKAVRVLEFVLPVLNVLLNRERVVVVLQNRVHVYSFAFPPSRLAHFDTAANPHGVAAITGSTVAFPGLVDGIVQLVDVSEEAPRVVGLIRAHKTPLRALAVTDKYVASASATGTIIRIHSIATTALVHEFRRGLDRAVVYSMGFSPDGSLLAVLSDKRTLHVYNTAGDNRRHILKNMPLGRKYFGSEWSFMSTQVHVDGTGVLGWVNDDTIVIIWKDALLWEKYAVLRVTQEVVREAWRRFN